MRRPVNQGFGRGMPKTTGLALAWQICMMRDPRMAMLNLTSNAALMFEQSV
jgi:hypothetical protein